MLNSFSRYKQFGTKLSPLFGFAKSSKYKTNFKLSQIPKLLVACVDSWFYFFLYKNLSPESGSPIKFQIIIPSSCKYKSYEIDIPFSYELLLLKLISKTQFSLLKSFPIFQVPLVFTYLSVVWSNTFTKFGRFDISKVPFSFKFSSIFFFCNLFVQLSRN
jgi:hypothetical protein